MHLPFSFWNDFFSNQLQLKRFVLENIIPLTVESEIVDSQNHVPIFGFDFVICNFVDI